MISESILFEKAPVIPWYEAQFGVYYWPCRKISLAINSIGLVQKSRIYRLLNQNPFVGEKIVIDLIFITLDGNCETECDLNPDRSEYGNLYFLPIEDTEVEKFKVNAKKFLLKREQAIDSF